MRRLLFALALATAAPVVMAASTAAPLLPPRMAHAIAERIAAGQYPALVVALVDGGRSRVYAFGKLADGHAPDASTLFQIGSITKTFTATVLAEAVDGDSVRLDTPVASLLPGFTVPTRDGQAITLGELAMQDSGLPHLPGNLQPTDLQDPYAGYDAAKLKAFLASYALPRDPGARYEYSNLGVGLLGFALARHANVAYAALLEARIFKPLGMASSFVGTRAAPGLRWADGHGAAGGPAPAWNFAALAGAGGVASTGQDMLRYLQANLGHGPARLVAAMRMAQQPRRGIGHGERIGLVWMTHHTPGGGVIWHNGETGGYASFIGLSTDRRRGVVVLANIARPVDDLGFAALLPDAPLTPVRKAIAMTPAQLDAYAGSYQLIPGLVLRVLRDGDRLSVQATGQHAFPVYPGAADAFFARGTNIQINFKRDKAGKVIVLVLHQDGTEQAARRVP